MESFEPIGLTSISNTVIKIPENKIRYQIEVSFNNLCWNVSVLGSFIDFKQAHFFLNFIFFYKRKTKSDLELYFCLIATILGFRLYFTMAFNTGSLMCSEYWSMSLYSRIFWFLTILEKKLLKWKYFQFLYGHQLMLFFHLK